MVLEQRGTVPTNAVEFRFRSSDLPNVLTIDGQPIVYEPIYYPDGFTYWAVDVTKFQGLDITISFHGLLGRSTRSPSCS